MPRLTARERESLMNVYDAHYELLLKDNPTWEIEEGFGRDELNALFKTYRDKQQEIGAAEFRLTTQRAQRVSLFGANIEDIEGIWFVLGLYSKLARARLPKSSALRKTNLTIGKVIPGVYDTVLGRFIEHWKLVNKELPADKPLVIAGKTLAHVQNLRQQIADLTTEITETLPVQLDALRAEREQIFGDVIAEEREPTSIIGRLELYSIEAQSQFAGTPIAQTIPRIFPEQNSTPRFSYNFRASEADIVLWWTIKEALQKRATALYLKSGLFEETRPLPTAPPYKVVFAGADSQDELDEVELRNDDGKTLASGRRDESLIEPV